MKDQVEMDLVDQVSGQTCWRCLLEPSPWIGGPGAWLSMALGVPTSCPDCGHWSFNKWRLPWWSGSWAWMPSTVFLLGFYAAVPLPAVGDPLADVRADQAEAIATVNPNATPLPSVWTTAGAGGAEMVKGRAGRDELVPGVGQLPAAAISQPLMASEVGRTEAPCALPQQDGDLPGTSPNPLVPTAHSGRATLCGEETPSPKVKQARKKQDRPGPGMEIVDDVFTQDEVRGLIDEWLVPMLVENFIRERIQGREEG